MIIYYYNGKLFPKLDCTYISSRYRLLSTFLFLLFRNPLKLAEVFFFFLLFSAIIVLSEIERSFLFEQIVQRNLCLVFNTFNAQPYKQILFQCFIYFFFKFINLKIGFESQGNNFQNRYTCIEEFFKTHFHYLEKRKAVSCLQELFSANKSQLLSLRL